MLKIGDRIICVDSSMQTHTVEELTKDVPNWIKEGKIYTIRGFGDYEFVVGIYLEEVHNPAKWFSSVGGFVEPAFRNDRFRKLESSESDIEICEEELVTT